MLYRALETVKAGCFCLRKLCTALEIRCKNRGKNSLLCTKEIKSGRVFGRNIVDNGIDGKTLH